jgi:hypothetical protein
MSDNPKLKKNGGNGTNVGNFLRGLTSKVLPTVIEAVGLGDIGKALGIINSSPDNAGLSKKEVDEFLKYYEMDLKDMASARDMYKSTDHEVADFVAKRVINFNLWVVLAALIIEVISVIYIEDKILIAIISGAIGSLTTALLQERQQIINFFFGSSMGSKKKQQTLDSK